VASLSMSSLLTKSPSVIVVAGSQMIELGEDITVLKLVPIQVDEPKA
jgi:hypothetical protein